MKKIQDTPLYELLPQSIKDDSTIHSSSIALDPLLQSSVDSITNLLILSRLGSFDKSSTLSMLAPFERLAEHKGGLKELSLEELEELAWQMHVDFREVATTKEELARMVLDSIAWHRIKGTPKSLTMALELFGYEVSIEEDGKDDYWATYQLGIEGVKSFEEIKHILTITKEVAPVRSQLFRIYNKEFDFRPMVWSEDYWSECFWSYYSGIEFGEVEGYEDENLIISFGQSHKAQSEIYLENKHAFFFYEYLHSVLCPYIDYFTWSYHAWGDELIKNHGFSMSELFSFHFAQRIQTSFTWEKGLWDTRKWFIDDYWDRPLPQWQILFSSYAKSQIFYSEHGLWGDLNACYSIPRATLIEQEAIWGDYFWSEEGSRIQDLEILGYEANTKNIQAEKSLANNELAFMFGNSHFSTHIEKDQSKSSFANTEAICLSTLEAHYLDKNWQGAWNNKAWGEIIGYGKKQKAWNFVIYSENL